MFYTPWKHYKADSGVCHSLLWHGTIIKTEEIEAMPKISGKTGNIPGD